MKPALDLLRHERRARRFFAVHLQSQLGTGAGYVALLLVAYQRLHEPWAITLVLLADFVPAVVLGPFLGALTDRCSRRRCAVAADLMRGAAFLGLAVVPGLGPMVALALIAGIGTSLFTPAVLSALPSLVDEDRAPAATSLFGAVNSIGMTAGPALGAVLLLAAAPTVLLAVNGVTFFLSAAVVAGLRFGARPEKDDGDEPASLLAETRAGLSIAAGMPVVRVLLWSSSAVILFAGMMNVAEPILATDVLGSGGTGFSVLVAVYGLGTFCGSLLSGRRPDASGRRRSYCAGLLTLAAGLVVSGLAPAYAVALAGFAATGAGNGMLLVSQQVLIQESVPDRAMGRVFGLLDAAGAGAFAVALLAAGGIVATLGARAVFIGAGLTGLLVCAAVWRLLSLSPSPASRAVGTEPATAL